MSGKQKHAQRDTTLPSFEQLARKSYLKYAVKKYTAKNVCICRSNNWLQ